MKNSKIRKLAALILCLAMALGVFQIPALARNEAVTACATVSPAGQKDGQPAAFVPAAAKRANEGGCLAARRETLYEGGASGYGDIAQWPSFRGNAENMAVTKAKTPRNQQEAVPKWASPVTTGSWTTPAGQILAGDYIYASALDKLYRIHKETGEFSSMDLFSSTGYSTVSPTCGAGLIFVGQEGGVIQAVDARTFSSRWVYDSGEEEKQALSPIVYEDGFLYTGFWQGETADGDYLCLDAKTGELVWSYTHKGGFYWAGAYISGDYVIVPSDNGSNQEDQAGALYSLNKRTGALADRMEIIGDGRSCVCYDQDSGRLCLSSKAGYIYTLSVDGKGRFTNALGVKAADSITSTPVSYGGYIYVGAQKDGENVLLALEAESLEMVSSWPMPGYPQGSMLLSAAYEDQGCLYLYSTCNSPPGGLMAAQVDIKSDTPAITGLSPLHTPQGEQADYCIVSVICGEDGTVYYANDSGYAFAVGRNVLARFTDLDEASVHYDDIRQAVDSGLFGGTGGSTFEPSSHMTRAMFVTALGRMYEAGGAQTAFLEMPGFADVQQGLWYSQYLAWAYENKIVEGYSDSLFGTNDPVTREQVAVFLHRYAGMLGLDLGQTDLSVYSDQKMISRWAENAISWAVEASIIRGTGENTLNPGGTATRAQVATMLVRLYAIL